jgi:hypothetical protein
MSVIRSWTAGSHRCPTKVIAQFTTPSSLRPHRHLPRRRRVPPRPPPLLHLALLEGANRRGYRTISGAWAGACQVCFIHDQWYALCSSETGTLPTQKPELLGSNLLKDVCCELLSTLYGLAFASPERPTSDDCAECNSHALTCSPDSSSGCPSCGHSMRERGSLPYSPILESDGLDPTTEKCVLLFQPCQVPPMFLEESVTVIPSEQLNYFLSIAVQYKPSEFWVFKDYLGGSQFVNLLFWL